MDKAVEAYQKVSGAAKGAKESVGGVFGGLGASIGSKFETLKQTEAFQSVSEKVGGAVSTVKGKVSSRSNSTQSFDEALREAEAQPGYVAPGTDLTSQDQPLGGQDMGNTQPMSTQPSLS